MRKVNERRKDAQGGLSMKAKVYFTREITPESVVRLYRALGVQLPGKVAVRFTPERRETRTSFIRSSGDLWWRRSTARL